MGSIPEIVVDRETGFLCATVEEAAGVVPLLRDLERQACRTRVETTFSRERMIDAYTAVYAKALELRVPPPPGASVLAARDRDYWDRPMAFTDDPAKPRTLRSGNPLA